MYVAELDRPWIETPFAFQGFVLQTERQLQALRKYCQHVFVDVGRSEMGMRATRDASGCSSLLLR